MLEYFGIAFNVPQLSGSLYMNMFLVSVVDLPGPVIVGILNIWYVKATRPIFTKSASLMNIPFPLRSHTNHVTK